MHATDSLPPAFATATAALVFAVTFLMVFAHALLAGRAAERSGVSLRARRWAPWLAAAFLGSWAGLAITFATELNVTAPSAGIGVGPIGLAPGVVTLLPFAAALAFLFGSRTWQAINAATPPSWLVGLQVYRVLGVIFLFPYLFYGVLPAGFAVPAGIGDVVTGGLSPVVAWQLARGRPSARLWAVVWNAFGILDLLVAPVAAVLSHAPVFSVHPIAVIPLFLGPPLGILTHLHSLRNLAAHREFPSPAIPMVAHPAGA
jgi:hypothetical protein